MQPRFDEVNAYLLTTALRMVEVQSVLEHTDTDEETFRKDICFIVSFMLPFISFYEIEGRLRLGKLQINLKN